MGEKRSSTRKAVGLLVKLAHHGLEEFEHKYATNLSHGGMFIRTREPEPVGRKLRFRVELADGLRVLQGTAVVRWVRGPEDGAPGMGIEFLSLDSASRALVDRMLRARPMPKGPIAPLTPVEPLRVVPPPKRPGAVASAARPEPASVPFVTEEGAAGPPRSEEEVFSTVVDSGMWTSEQAAAPVMVPPPAGAQLWGPRDGASEIDLELADLVAATPSPPEAAPAEGAAEFDIDLELVAQPAAPAVLFDASPSEPRWLRPEAPAAPPAPPVVLVPPPPAASRPPVLEEKHPEGPIPLVQSTTGPVFLTGVEEVDGTGPIIGIDLGTTNSACAVLSKGRPIILNSKDGYNTIPSVVALTPQGKLLVGHRAKSQMTLNPTRSIWGAKRLVGRAYDSPTVRQVRERFHYEICSGTEGRAAVRLGPHVLAREEVQGLILRECREMAEQVLGQPVKRAVVTCPAYYSEPQREAVRRAGRMAGLKVERVLNEPTAAALAFGMNRELTKKVLVYDLGGGTFDATLVRLDQNVFEVLATGGDVFLGGVDFDNQIVDLLLERYARQHGESFAGDRVALSRVVEMAERAKVALSGRTGFEVQLPMLELDRSGAPRDLTCTVTRKEIEGACEELVDRTIQVVQDVLLDAKLKATDVDDVILVGGMSRMPMVRERLQQVFKKPAHASVNADEAVALGAALYTGTIDKVSSVVLIDVVPMTIGLGKVGGGFHRLIERNTPLPATKSFGISTHEDNQEVLEVMLFQGEDANVAGNELLGAVHIDGLPRGPKGSVQVAVSLSLDAECVLKVEAREFRTRKAVAATLATRFTGEEVAKRLHITEAKSAEAQATRGQELEKRAGGFWGRLKKALSRG